LEIYLDILFLENLVINYMILTVTHRLSKNNTTNLRKFLGALVGALYVVVLILFPGIKYYYTVFAKILLSFLIIKVSFPITKIKIFLKVLAIFYISTFIFAGAAFSFLYFNNNGGFVKNGIVYVFWDSKITVILLSVFTIAILLKIIWEVIQHKINSQQLIISLFIEFEENKTIKVPALIDTGNLLIDPLTKVPVVVVEFCAIKEILPIEIQEIFQNKIEDDLPTVTKIVSTSTWFSKFRVIPFNSLGKENGILIGFKPDYIKFKAENNNNSGEEIKNVIIGIYNRKISKNDNYSALIGSELIYQ